MKKKTDPRSPFSKKALLFIMPLLVVLLVLIGILIFRDDEKEVVFKDYGFAITNTNRLVGIMRVPGSSADINEIICPLSSDESIIVKDGEVTYKGEKLSGQIPLFFDNSSYIFIPWEEAVFLTDDFGIKTVDGSVFLIKEAFFGDDYTRKDSGKGLLLLSCTKNLFLALEEFSITTIGESFTVKPMDLVLFDGYSIKTARISDTEAQRGSYGITNESLVTVNGHTYVMRDFLSALGLSVERDSSLGGLEKTEIGSENGKEKEKDTPKPIDDTMLKLNEETFQYFLGHRYQLKKDVEVYSLDGVWYLKNDDLASRLETIPMYGEEYVYLPGSFGLVNPSVGKQYSLPGFTRIKREAEDDGYIAYTARADKHKLLPRSVIFDGTENYLFTDSVTVEWKDHSFTLAPLSYVSWDGIERLEFYDSGEDKFYSYILQLDSVKVRFEDGNGVDVVSGTVLNEDLTGFMIINEPGLLASYFDK